MGEIIVVVLVLYVMINNHCCQLFTQGNSKKGKLKEENCVMNSILVISI